LGSQAVNEGTEANPLHHSQHADNGTLYTLRWRSPHPHDLIIP